MELNPDGTRQSKWAQDSDADGDPSSPEDTAIFEPFKDLIKQRFMWYYESYLASIEKEKTKVAESQAFVKMPFEHPGNTMDGVFLYKNLERRLKFIRQVLDEEPAQWAVEGKDATAREMGVSANLRRQFEQTLEHYRKNEAVTLDIELVEDNPFVWELVGLLAVDMSIYHHD